MASITAVGANGHHRFTLIVEEAYTYPDENASSVSYAFQLSPVETSWNWEQWGTSISYSLKINNQTITGTIPNYDGSSRVQLTGGVSTKITHNSDGAKTISYSFTVADNSGQSYTPGNASASGALALSTFSRATTPTLSATSVTMGGSVTLTLTPATNTAKHKIRYAFGSVTNSVVGVSIGADFTATGTTKVTFTPPVSLASEIPSATSGKCTITCYTYTSAGLHTGTTTVTLTLNVPSYAPTISNIAVTGYNLLSGAYVQGKSYVGAKITAVSSYGATITAYSSVVDGKTYTGSTFSTSALSDGTKTVKTTVTDSRGKTATVESASFVVYAYSIPYVTKFTLARQTDGTTVIATLVGGVSNVNGKNAKTFTVTLNGVTKTITSTTNTVNGTATFTGVPTDSTFEAKATIKDSYLSVTRLATLPTVAVTLDFYKDGTGIAMGKVAEQGNLFEVAWDTELQGRLEVAKGIKTAETLEVSSNIFGATLIKRNDSANAAAIKFANTNGVLGAIGMTQTADGGLRRWTADTSGAYFILDTGNITNYIKDYVIEQGTSNGWNYTKWKNGKIELYGDKSLTFPAGTVVATGVNRSIVTIELNSFLTTIISGSCPVQYNGMIPQVCRHSTYPTRAEIVILTNRDIAGFTITAPIYIIGEWK